MLCGPKGVLIPGERARGGAWRCAEAAVCAARAAADIEVAPLTVGEVIVEVVGCVVVFETFVVIVRGLEDVALAVVVVVLT